MQQRQLRLGDILDDYCPRERRLANHTVVAMVGDEVRLTRCTTCDTEHPYKGGKVPRQRNLTAFIRMLRVARRATRQPDFVADHRDNSVVRETALARTIVVQGIAKP